MVGGSKIPFLARLLGLQTGKMMFHPTLANVGLLPTEDAPIEFKCFIEGILRDWDFDNWLSAHNGYKKGGAKNELKLLLDKSLKKLKSIGLSRAKDKTEWENKFASKCVN